MGLVYKPEKGDVSCGPRAVSDVRFGTPDRHGEVRRVTVARLRRATAPLP